MTTSAPEIRVSPAESPGKSKLVIVYHRQPFEEAVEGGKTVYRENKSPNGIVPALKGFFGAVDKGCWIAWKQAGPRTRAFERRIRIEDSQGAYEVVRIPLTPEQVKSFYHVTSKEALWPILHSFPGKFNYDAVDWDTFREVNRHFAEAACEEAADDALIWIHDYNLWLAPHFIRKLKPKARIAFFHHTPFPSADIFSILPWRDEIIDSLLDCDLVGFHVPRYAKNFFECARSLRGAEAIEAHETDTGPFVGTGAALSHPNVTTRIKVGEREVHIDAWPIGANPKLISDHLSTFDAGRRVTDIRNEVKEQKLLLSVGRVDYVKGTEEMLQAFDRLLDRRPELRGKVKLFCIAVASASNMTVYKQAQREVERLVGSINGKYGTLSWTPIMLSTRGVPFHELVCYYRAADVCWITPLRDGLNLVCKEFVAAQNGEPGVLVLSEFAGAAVELPEACMANPYSADSMDAAIDAALDMSPEERRKRMDAMTERVETWDVAYWARHVTEQFEAIGADDAAGKKGGRKAA